MSLTEDSLLARLNMTDSTHRKALMFAIGILAEQGVKMPATLWEYKVQNQLKNERTYFENHLKIRISFFEALKQ